MSMSLISLRRLLSYNEKPEAPDTDKEKSFYNGFHLDREIEINIKKLASTHRRRQL